MGSSASGTGRSGEEEQDGEESQAVPSFQNAFNEALLTASVSVLAAQSGKFVYTCRHACDKYMYLNSQYLKELHYCLLWFLQHQKASRAAKLLRKVERSLSCSPQGA